MTAAIYHTQTMNTASQHHPLPYPQTPATALAWMRTHGICISHWARDLHFPRHLVVDCLRGRIKGDRGASHRVAIALGLKPNPDQQAPV